MSKPFVLNRHNRLVFPSNFEGDLDFSVIDTELQLEDVVRRDFEAKAPKGAEIAERATQGAYRTKYQLLRDMALNLFWSNRFAITMYDKRPMRWRDVPKKRSDIYIPVLQPWEDGADKVATITRVYEELPAEWDEGVESRIGRILGDVFNNKRHHATSLEPIKPTIAEFIEKGTDLAYTLAEYDPDYPVYSFQEILDCNEDIPELEALQRMAMVLHNQSPWDRSRGRLASAGEIGDDDFVNASREHNATWRAWLAGELEALGNHGVRVVPSATNFLLVLFEGEVSAETVYNRLMDAGYIVRWLPGQGIPQALRMTIGTEDETRGLAAAIRAALAG